MPPEKDQDGWCVEYVVEEEHDPINGHHPGSEKYQQQFFTVFATAQYYARWIACQEPCPCVMGDIAIHNATYTKHGKLQRHWRIDDDPHTEYVEVPVQAERMTA